MRPCCRDHSVLIGCLAAPLTSTNQIPIATIRSPVVKTKMSPDTAKWPLGKNHHPCPPGEKHCSRTEDWPNTQGYLRLSLPSSRHCGLTSLLALSSEVNPQSTFCPLGPLWLLCPDAILYTPNPQILSYESRTTLHKGQPTLTSSRLFS